MVARFERASDAVAAALAFPEHQSMHFAKFEDGTGPRLRIGIALGEVIVDSHVVTGVGVVFAQRAEQLAPPDGISIIPTIHTEIECEKCFGQSWDDYVAHVLELVKKFST